MEGSKVRDATAVRDLRPETLITGTVLVIAGSPMHVTFEIIAAILIILPMVALALGYRRTKSPRLLLALMAFGILQVRVLSLVSMHLLQVLDHELEETVNFIGDLAAMGMFAIAFLYPSRWSGVRGLASAT